MNYFILVLLLVGAQSLDPTTGRCIGSAIRTEKGRIISNIRNKMPQNNNRKMLEIYNEVLFCVTRSYMANGIVRGTFYRYIYRIILQKEDDLTSIHKDYCNHGKETGIKKCSSTLGENYPCDELMNSFGPCSNDYNFKDGL